MTDPTLILAALAALVFLGLALEELFKRTKIPDVLVLLCLGLGLSAIGVLDTESFAGIERIFTTVALVLILFEGAVQMRLGELRRAFAQSTALTFLNFFGTMALVGGIAWAFFGMRPLAGLLLGAIVGGTSSAVVIPMVQSLKLQSKAGTSLALESALSDVLCIVFVLALVGAFAAGEVSVPQMAASLGISFGGALILGIATGVTWAFGLKRLRRRRTSLLATAAVVFLVHALAESLQTSGAIACLAFGVVLGNAPALARSRPDAAEFELTEGERLFLSEVAFLLKIFFFVYLGASLKLSGFEPLVYGGATALACFIIRPFVVRLTFSPRGTGRRDAAIASVLVPKGLAAAVLAGIPLRAGVAEGAVIESTAFGVILFSILGSSLLVFAVDRPALAGVLGKLFRAYPAALPEGAADPSGPSSELSTVAPSAEASSAEAPKPERSTAA